MKSSGSFLAPKNIAVRLGLADRLSKPVRKIRNVVIDLQFGGLLNGIEPNKFGHVWAHWIESISYDELRYICPRGFLSADDVAVDVGCGKGRVLNWWLKEYGTRNKLIGIEIDPDWAERTRRRLARYPSVEIITGNALQVLPLINGTVFFLFNPFDETVMRGLEELLRGKNVRVVYYNPKHLSVWQNGHWDLETKQMPPGRHFFRLNVIRPHGL